MHMRRRYRLRIRYTGWLLITALFVSNVQPMHVHLEHKDGLSGHGHDHVTDLHFAADKITSSGHEDTVIPLTPEGLLKKYDNAPQLATILVFLIFLLPGVVHTCRQWLSYSRILPGSAWYVVAPPLRAPPRP